MTSPPTPGGRRLRLSQLRALRELGLDAPQRRAFLRGEVVLYYSPTRAEPAVAVAQLVGIRLRSGMIAIRDVGGGLGVLARFRTRSHAVARACGASEVELFGAAFINQRLEALLLRQGFARATEPVPEELGGGTMEIVTKLFPVG
jgi:hypothetical protein